MFKKLSFLGANLLLTFSILLTPVHSQERYEKFIPFEYHPGLSNKYTALGSIVEVDKDKKTVTIRTDAKTHSYKVTKHTQIWLDRSQLKARNLKGSFSDLKEGLRAEIEMDPTVDKEEESAKWIKIQMPPSQK
jgi:hypothetical protein